MRLARGRCSSSHCWCCWCCTCVTTELPLTDWIATSGGAPSRIEKRRTAGNANGRERSSYGLPFTEVHREQWGAPDRQTQAAIGASRRRAVSARQTDLSFQVQHSVLEFLSLIVLYGRKLFGIIPTEAARLPLPRSESVSWTIRLPHLATPRRPPAPLARHSPLPPLHPLSLPIPFSRPGSKPGPTSSGSSKGQSTCSDGNATDRLGRPEPAGRVGPDRKPHRQRQDRHGSGRRPAHAATARHDRRLGRHAAEPAGPGGGGERTRVRRGPAPHLHVRQAAAARGPAGHRRGPARRGPVHGQPAQLHQAQEDPRAVGHAVPRRPVQALLREGDPRRRHPPPDPGRLPQPVPPLHDPALRPPRRGRRLRPRAGAVGQEPDLLPHARPSAASAGST